VSKNRNKKSGELTPKTSTEAEAAEAEAPPAEFSTERPPEPEPVTAEMVVPERAQPPTPPAVRVRAVADPDQMVTIRPLTTVKRIRIGTKWYSFLKGKACMVPANAVPHLRRKSIIG